jgi:hypothetical protein
MAKKGPRPRKSNRDRPKETTKHLTTFWQAHKTLLELIGGVSAILGIAGFFLNFAPKLSVQISDSLDPSNPMATVFVLTNQGYLPIHDVVAACGAAKLSTPKITIDSAPDARMVLPGSQAEILSAGHNLTLPCGHLFGTHEAIRAEITIIVEYRPDWVWWHRTERFPWKAEKRADGTWTWDSVPR